MNASYMVCVWMEGVWTPLAATDASVIPAMSLTPRSPHAYVSPTIWHCLSVSFSHHFIDYHPKPKHPTPHSQTAQKSNIDSMNALHLHASLWCADFAKVCVSWYANKYSALKHGVYFICRYPHSSIFHRAQDRAKPNTFHCSHAKGTGWKG